MVRDDLQASRLPEDFPARIGRVIAQRGPIVDARFAAEHAPTPLDVIASEDAVSFAVIQQLGDGRVRCLALDPGQPIAAGAPLKATGELVEKPLSLDVLEAALGVLLQGRDSSEAIVETGIKALDLLCPLPSSGAMALYGPQGAGKIVVLGEIIHRLRSQDPALALLNFTQADTLKSIQFDDPLPVGGGKLDAVYLPVADAARPESASVAQTREAIQGTIYCSREMALESLYPAIDSFISSSRLLHPDRVGPRHAAIAEGVRARLSTGPEGRAQRLRLFLTQPFFTTEAYTNLPGEYVSLAQTLDGCEAILSGGVDDIPEDAFRFTGTLEQIRERASAM